MEADLVWDVSNQVLTRDLEWELCLASASLIIDGFSTLSRMVWPGQCWHDIGIECSAAVFRVWENIFLADKLAGL